MLSDSAQEFSVPEYKRIIPPECQESLDVRLLSDARAIMERARINFTRGSTYQNARAVGMYEILNLIADKKSIEDSIAGIKQYRYNLDLLGEIRYQPDELSGRLRSATESIEFFSEIRQSGQLILWYFPLEM